MSESSLEERVAILEKQVAEIQRKLGMEPAKSWVERISGAFADDPIYDEAMRLGREYRESLRPKARATKPKQKGTRRKPRSPKKRK